MTLRGRALVAYANPAQRVMILDPAVEIPFSLTTFPGETATVLYVSRAGVCTEQAQEHAKRLREAGWRVDIVPIKYEHVDREIDARPALRPGKSITQELESNGRLRCTMCDYASDNARALAAHQSKASHTGLVPA